MVTAAIDEASLSRGLAAAAAPGDLSAWDKAIGDANRARDLLQADEIDAVLKARVDTLLALLRQEQAEAVRLSNELKRDAMVRSARSRGFIMQVSSGGLTRSLPDHATIGTACNYLGETLLEYGEYDAAYRLVHEALQFEPRNPTYIGSLGCAQYARGELKGALVNLRQAEKLERSSSSKIKGRLDLIERSAGIQG